MDAPLFEIQNGVLTECRMSGEENMTVTIPDGVTSIGKNAFLGCGLLQSITIPDSVTSIGDNAFLICDSLQSIDVSESNSNYLSCDGVLFDKYKSILIKYPQGKKELSFMIPDGVKSIKQYAFDNCKSLRSITIPDSVKRIASDAFYHCDNLTILAPAGSYAIEYARDNGIKFKEI